MAKRILIIDDDMDFVEACQNMLEAADYEVECESVFEKSLGKIRGMKPDLILLDILMDNKIVGFDIAEAICADRDLKDIPVIFLTGYFRRSNTLERDSDMMRKLKNVRAVVDKPVKPNKLLEEIARVL